MCMTDTIPIVALKTKKKSSPPWESFAFLRGPGETVGAFTG